MLKPIIIGAISFLSLGSYAANDANRKPKPSINASAKALVEQRLRNLYQQMELTKSGLEFNVFTNALVGYTKLDEQQLLSGKQVITIIDFGKPSTEKRLWVLDLKHKKILYHSLVAHGQGTGDKMARYFSNTAESHMSSLGFYVTNDTYLGKHGLSLRLLGQETDYNSNALSRAVVMHGADYVSESFIEKHGRLGRSHGCPAVPTSLNKPIIDTIKDRTCLYIHAPAANYRSDLLTISNEFEELIKSKLGL